MLFADECVVLLRHVCSVADSIVSVCVCANESVIIMCAFKLRCFAACWRVTVTVHLVVMGSEVSLRRGRGKGPPGVVGCAVSWQLAGGGFMCNVMANGCSGCHPHSNCVHVCVTFDFVGFMCMFVVFASRAMCMMDYT